MENRKYTLAIITARGGSKRIPRKNIKEFCGKPIVAYSIEAAKQAGVFDEIMVSTDDEEIAEVGRQYGADIPFFRSSGTSDDFATTADVLLEVLEEYEKRGKKFTHICCIYPTAPFVTAQNLKQAMEQLTAKQADSVMPVVRFSFPPQRSVIVGANGNLTPKWEEYMNCRSQDLEPFYHDCGQFYCLNVESFQKEQKMIMNHTLPLFMDEMQVQDIDTEEDWRIAEMKYRILNEK
ncbi:MAG: pseudaminic acid cytidylyltransferase [Lachnospiraceae bacterium]|nr:pseudaminic acid cytidylyltransferase [Lachnospiraceae bacterium]